MATKAEIVRRAQMVAAPVKERLATLRAQADQLEAEAANLLWRAARLRGQCLEVRGEGEA